MEKNKQIHFRVSEADDKAFRDAADKHGLDLSVWLREVAKQAAGLHSLLRDDK
jgi:hypothetical protein